MAVPMTLTDIKEYSLTLNTVLDCTMYNQITDGDVALTKALLTRIKIFAVYLIVKENNSNRFYLYFMQQNQR